MSELNGPIQLARQNTNCTRAGCSYRLPVFGKRSLCVARRGRFLNTGKRRLHQLTHHLIRDGVLAEAARVAGRAVAEAVGSLGVEDVAFFSGDVG